MASCVTPATTKKHTMRLKIRTWVVFFWDSFNSIADIFIDDCFPQRPLGLCGPASLTGSLFKSAFHLRKAFPPMLSCPFLFFYDVKLYLRWDREVLPQAQPIYLCSKLDFVIDDISIILVIYWQALPVQSIKRLFLFLSTFKMFKHSQTALLLFPPWERSQKNPTTSVLRTLGRIFKRRTNDSESKGPSTLCTLS